MCPQFTPQDFSDVRLSYAEPFPYALLRHSLFPQLSDFSDVRFRKPNAAVVNTARKPGAPF
jgi:hypothetical protein